MQKPCLAAGTELQLQTQILCEQCQMCILQGIIFGYLNGQTQVEPESCVKYRVQKAVQDVGVRVHLCVYRGRLMRNGTLVLHAVSHCSAVLYASLGGDVGPGQQRAQQGLGLSVQPLRDGAGAQAGQG